PLADNVIPSIGDLKQDGAFSEEWKLIHETRTILNLPDLKVFSTSVRVPVTHCHSEAVHAKFRKTVNPEAAHELLRSAPGIVVLDDPAMQIYPMPRECVGSDEVFVGRIRQLPGARHTLDLWIVSDNLRKGAATNAVQILSLLQKKQFLCLNKAI
ncbi:MAG: Asd/ArgC dimerization domain-containing protein, partial [bacterium]